MDRCSRSEYTSVNSCLTALSHVLPCSHAFAAHQSARSADCLWRSMKGALHWLPHAAWPLCCPAISTALPSPVMSRCDSVALTRESSRHVCTHCLTRSLAGSAFRLICSMRVLRSEGRELAAVVQGRTCLSLSPLVTDSRESPSA